MVKKETPYLWLFGGGGAATWLIQGLARVGVSLYGILDDNVSGLKALSGLKILSPDSKVITDEIKFNSVVIMAILNPLYDTNLIKDRLVREGWGKVIDYGQWVQEHYNSTKQCAAPITADEMDDLKITQVRALLEDDESITNLDNFLGFVKTGRNIETNIDLNIYFTKSIPPMREPLRMIDCGAYTADTILQAKSLGYSIDFVYAFEPDATNYKKLYQNTKGMNNIICLPCGVGKTTEFVKFECQSDMGSCIHPNGTNIIQTVSLDECVFNYSTNFIKMDIEGAEYDALLGAEQILRKYKPRLAISVYHLPSDIWKIPCFLYDIYGNGAKYYLRHHSRTIADTVFYVVPYL